MCVCVCVCVCEIGTTTRLVGTGFPTIKDFETITNNIFFFFFFFFFLNYLLTCLSILYLASVNNKTTCNCLVLYLL